MAQIYRDKKDQAKNYNQKVRAAKQLDLEAQENEARALGLEEDAAGERKRAARKRKQAALLRNEAAAIAHDQPMALQQHRFMQGWESETSRASRELGGPGTPLPLPAGPSAMGMGLAAGVQQMDLTDEEAREVTRRRSRSRSRHRTASTLSVAPSTSADMDIDDSHGEILQGWPPRKTTGAIKHTPSIIHSKSDHHVPLTEDIIATALTRANRLLDTKIKGSSFKDRMSDHFEATTQGLQHKDSVANLLRTIATNDKHTTMGREAYLSMLEISYPSDPTFRFLLPATRGCIAMFKDKHALQYACWLLGHTPKLMVENGKARVVSALAHMLAVDVVTLEKMIKE